MENNDSFKKFILYSKNSKVNERIALLKEINHFVKENANIPEKILKTCIYGIFQTLPHYHDICSRRHCLNLIIVLLNNNPLVCIPSFVELLEPIAKFQKINSAPNRSESAKSLVALNWTNAIVETFTQHSEKCKTDWKVIVDLQASFFYGAMSSRSKSISKSALKTLKRLWKNIPDLFEKYTSALITDEPTISSCALLTAMRHLDSDSFQKKKMDIINAYAKAIIFSKTLVPSHALKTFHGLHADIDHECFEKILCPALQKSLLRSPEKVMIVFLDIVENMRIDLSRHALGLTKMISQHLVSKNDANREIAEKIVAKIAFSCSDSGSVEEVVKLLFSLLKGSEGKLTIAGQKISVLNSIGSMGESPVGTGSSALNVVKDTISLFLTFLQQEPHDGTLVVAVASLTKWCSNLKNEIPNNFLAWLKKMPTAKSSTPAVRTAYIECMLAMFKSDNYYQIEPLLPYLFQTIDKARQQQSQIPIVTEALYASSLLSKLENVEFQKPQKFGRFWTTILDGKSSLFTSNKFVQSASDDTVHALVRFASQLILDHAAKIDKDISRLYYQILIQLLLTKSYSVRKYVSKTIKKFLSSNSGADACLSLLTELSLVIADDILKFSSSEDHVQARKISSRYSHVMQCCLTMPSLKSNKQLVGKVAVKILIDCHRSCISFFNENFLQNFLRRQLISTCDFVEDNLAEITQIVVFANDITEVHLAALKNLIAFAPDLMLPLVNKRLQDTFDGDELHKVTKREFEIMNTPADELWNMEIIESFPKIVENKTMKRESKTYSFQDQLMEMELRKELEEKKKLKDTGGAKGTGGSEKASRMPTNLTKKQQEIVDMELKKEAEIRSRIKEVDRKCQAACQIFQASLETFVDVDLLLGNFAPLVKSLISLLPSSLASRNAQELFVLLTTSIMPEPLKLLGKQIAYTTLRLYKPATRVDQRWCFERTDQQVISNLEKLSKSFQSDPQPATIFSFFFPFLEKILLQSGAVVRGNSDLMCLAIKLILVHVTHNEESHLIPRSAIVSCMCQLIGTSEVKVQELASTALTAVCHSYTSKKHKNPYEEIKILLNGLLSPLVELRSAALECLIIFHSRIRSLDKEETSSLNAVRRVWVAMHDVDENIQSSATELWTKLRYSVTSTLCTEILSDLCHHEAVIQQAAALSLHEALDVHSEVASLTLQCLIDLYCDKRERPPPIMDEFGRVVAEAPPDDFQSRIGIGYALKAISPNFSLDDDVESLFNFFLPDALCDPHLKVREAMLEAAVQAVNDHGRKTTSILLNLFEDFLRETPTSQQYDDVRQSVVILLGTLAKHLDKNDPKIKPIVAKLTETLSTPSQVVQESVAKCLPSLVPSIKADAPDIVRKLLVILTESNNYGERKGAAYGLAGMVKGLGIISFKQLDIMTTLTEAIQDKKEYKRKEGALLAFEMFCKMLGRLFEPYIVHVLPHLLLCFGDNNPHVRQAANDTARAVMNNLSAHGVRLVLPSLLNGLKSEESWRTKTGSAELLGAMAFCAPKQLSTCLPAIVPELCEVLTDSHHKVQKAGEQALKKIGSVIRNPEIQAISGVLLGALTDPKKIANCLNILLKTKFVHFIDAPSLALILPVVERSFRDRSTDTRKMAAQIIGNMYSLTDEKDLKPYLSNLMPGLKTTLLDPAPEVRAIAAKALGAMVKVTGETQFEELMPWLMEHLTSEQTSVDRSGAAQGLSEVLASLGNEKLIKLMPEIVRTADSSNILPHVRDGYLMLFVYLPITFGEDFIPHIADVVQPLLKGLADENEYVRSTALTAGQRIISLFSEKSISVLLPQLEKGLFDENWRIRLSSVKLVGDFLYHISGITGKMSATGDDDENYGTAECFNALETKLGLESRNLALSGLYMGRCDVALTVRQAALHVWKVVVPNTPRVLREILPTLFKLLLGCLASHNYDKRQIAARTLGDIVRKLGERMLPELIPILERGLESNDSAQRQGVCIGLTEIIRSCSKEAIASFTGSLVPTVRKALCDDLAEVRLAAATTFENLHTTIGNQVLDGILPPLLEMLNDEETSEAAVDALKQVIAVKGHAVLPFVVPKLTEPPVNTKILAFFSAVAGEALIKHLPKVLKTLIDVLVSQDGSSDFTTILNDVEKVIISVQSEHGMRIIIDDLLLGVKSSNEQIRYVNTVLLHIFCKSSECDYSDYISVFIQSFFKLLADTHVRIQSKAWESLSAITSTFDAAEQQQHINSVRNALRYIRNDEVVLETGLLPGFCLEKKGLSPLLPMFREGILNGSPDLKEQTARAIGDCIQYLTPIALKPSVVSITGPLIRILGDRFSWNVKLAVLETLSRLLEKVGVFLKPFLPQLQTTFTKALQDANRSVRLEAGKALANLCTIHTRIDPLFTELTNNIRNSEEVSFKETALQAARGCIRNGGSKIGEKIKAELLTALTDELESNEDSCRNCAAACLGTLLSYLQDAQVSSLLNQQILAKEADASWSLKQGRSTLLAIGLRESPSVLLADSCRSSILDEMLLCVDTDRVQVVMDGIRSASYLLCQYSRMNENLPTHIIDAYKLGLLHNSNDVKIEAARSISWCNQQLEHSIQTKQANGDSEHVIPFKASCQLMSMLLPRTTEKNTGVKSAAEHAIVSLLKLRRNDFLLQKMLKSLTANEANILQDLSKQKLKKIASSTEIIEEIDNTLIKS